MGGASVGQLSAGAAPRCGDSRRTDQMGGVGPQCLLFGAEPGWLRALSAALWVPCLPVAGYHHGYFAESEGREIVREIEQLKPDILWLLWVLPARAVIECSLPDVDRHRRWG